MLPHKQVSRKTYYVKKTLRVVLFILINIYLFYLAQKTHYERELVLEDIYIRNMLAILMLYITFYVVVINIILMNRSLKKLITSGIKTKALILNEYSSSKLHHIKYEYTDEKGNSHIKTYRPTKEAYKTFITQGYVKGNYFDVLYDPNKPKCCYPVYVTDNFII